MSFHFHILKKTRDKYNFDKELFTLDGNVILSDEQTVRLFAHRMNEKRDLKTYPEQAIKASDLNAMGLIDEILHYVIGVYCQEKNPQAFPNAIKEITNKYPKVVDKTTTRFVELFPPLNVYKGEVSVEEYVDGITDDISNIEIISQEVLLLCLANNNPAFLPFIELFDDRELSKEAPYEVFIGGMIDFFKHQPVFGPTNQPLIDFMRAPVEASPNSLIGQLEYIRDNWGMILSPELMHRILLALDILREERKPGFLGPGPSLVPSFKGYEYEEAESFSPDLDWMSNVVLIAKNTYVWLDQLSKKYCRSITKLDEIPDEELDILARWGFSGLWLIGLWERNPASQKIKQISGNPEAIASAYSVYDYTIANDLGGEEALKNLKSRAWYRGIRLTSDMVPNHMGSYSKWVIEHPDWFIQLPYPPFPSYSFSGVNLSSDPRVGIYIEDGYWDRRDAAVVFKRVDHWTGDTRYIYHGNDGTSMPWNDTAQLNFTREDVREAVIQTILHVARNFPIIRFDAAMTLTKKHYQRLWFPHPGTGGDIPSRAGQGMSREEFERLFPKEFWREVVDRVAREVPDTLLLAEAFWLMEGYFVRTLGMHRVYNSAFMNMLKREENANYRSVIKKVIEFNPEILRRFVNFMNNPDEETAVAQFGKGDKYFGIAIMMVTMPGLPMFGHGQIEGFAEKYGMEYRKDYWNETIDWGLVHRHEEEVFPLMRKRYLFSGVENFVLYDFYTNEGYVNEDVFAYSNSAGDEKALIIYHNRYATAKGWINVSASFSSPQGLIQKTLAQALNINSDERYYYFFRDAKTNLEYIRQGKELATKGLYVELNAYQYHIFSDFREVCDDYHWYYARLASSLNGRGIHNMDEAYKEIYLEPILISFKKVMNKDMLKKLVEDKEVNLFKENMQELFLRIKEFVQGEGDEVKITQEVIGLLNTLKKYCQDSRMDEKYKHILLTWLIVQKLGQIKTDFNYEQQSAGWLDEWLLGKIVAGTFEEMGYDNQTAKHQTYLLKILILYSDDFSNIFEDSDVQKVLNFNWHNGILWLSKEALEELMYLLFSTSVINLMAKTTDDKKLSAEIKNKYRVIRKVIQSAKKSQYQVKEMLPMLK